jgi:hypothetical protein
VVFSRRGSAACRKSLPRIRRNFLAVKKRIKTMKIMSVSVNPSVTAFYTPQGNASGKRFRTPHFTQSLFSEMTGHQDYEHPEINKHGR